jgi:hypothetical protein
MKNNQLLLLLLILVFFACQKDDHISSDEGNPSELIDSVHIDFLDLDLSILPDRFIPRNFVVDENNIIWMSNQDSYREYPNSGAVLLGYDINHDEWQAQLLPPEWSYKQLDYVVLGKDNEIFCMLGWGLHEEVATYKDGNWKLYEFDDIVWNIAASPVDGALWVSGLKGLYRQLGDERTTFNSENSILPVNEDTNGSYLGYIEVDSSGTVWAAGNTNLYFYDGIEWQEHPNSPIGEDYIVKIISRARENSIFTYTPHENFYEINEEGFLKDYTSIFPFKSSVSPSYFQLSLNPINQNIIIAENGLLTHYNATLDSISFISRENAAFPKLSSFYNITRDRNNAVWVGGDNFLGKLPPEFE